MVIVSRLRGLSKFQVSNVTLGLSTEELDNLLDTVSCLQLAAHRILITVGLEFRQFQDFSAWLHLEIETQASDPESAETSEKTANINHASTLEYIQGPMMRSQLELLFNLQGQREANPRWNLAAEGRSLFELYKRESKNIQKEDLQANHLPGLDALVEHLSTQCDTVFGRIAETQRRNVRFGSPVAVGLGLSECMELKVSHEVKYSTVACTSPHI